VSIIIPQVPEAVFSLDDPSTPTASDAPTPGRRRMQRSSSPATRTTPSLFERAGVKKDEPGQRSAFRLKQTKYAGARAAKETTWRVVRLSSPVA
jgi:hypothetical protein